MKMHWMKFVVAAFSAAVCLTGAAGAHAAQICWVSYNPSAGAVGNFGTVSVGMGSPTCNVTNNFVFCSTGATSTAVCELTHLYREPALFAIYAALLEAKANAWELTVQGTYTGQGTNFRGKNFTVNQ